MAAVDSWSDGWESIADVRLGQSRHYLVSLGLTRRWSLQREAVKAKSSVVEAVEGNGSSSGSSTTSNSSLTASTTSPKILSKNAPAEEENRKIWEAASVPLVSRILL